jgi:hypothetical protein
MPPRYIYFNDEIYNKLKKESNASQLITKLLHKHYKSKEKKKEVVFKISEDKLYAYKEKWVADLKQNSLECAGWDMKEDEVNERWNSHLLRIKDSPQFLEIMKK